MKVCLVVDDSEVLRRVARRIFEQLQFEAVEAASGQDALSHCARSMPDAILLDSHMPPMAPAEFLATLRALANGDRPHVIYCATENDPVDINRALVAGADDYLLKPFDRESVRAKLAAANLV
jgi:two-component system, chemotaxis family, chemotaxis protein CheY